MEVDLHPSFQIGKKKSLGVHVCLSFCLCVFMGVTRQINECVVIVMALAPGIINPIINVMCIVYCIYAVRLIGIICDYYFPDMT